MTVKETRIKDLYLVQPAVFGDKRGYFLESWSRAAFKEAGLPYDFVQDNHSFSSAKGTLRGIHFQRGDKAQAKLVRCVRGSVWDVAVDLRPESPTYREWFALELSAENKRQLLIPRHFGHAFLTLTDNVEFLYKVDREYAPADEGGIRWDDPVLGIQWGIRAPILSEKDKNLPLLSAL